MQTFKTSRAKENILARIRKELNKTSLPIPFADAEKRAGENIYASSGLSAEEEFAVNFSRLGGRFVFCTNHAELVTNIYALYETREWQKMLCSHPEILKLLQTGSYNIAASVTEQAEEADVCITGCEALVARTGSAIISSRQYMGRTSTIFYPVHIIVAYARQVVPDIQEGLALMKARYGANLPSMINLNTGPSRTADIEKTLVVGVHGPAEVFCFLVNEE